MSGIAAVGMKAEDKTACDTSVCMPLLFPPCSRLCEIMARTVITNYTARIVRDLVERAKELKGPSQLNLIHGELKELFIAGMLKKFLPSPLGVGSGTVINMNGTRGRQTDVIIYDNRILPPFIQEQHLGVYPVESVIATIEVKTTLSRCGIEQAKQAASVLDEIAEEEGRLLRDKRRYKWPIDPPVCAVFGFRMRGRKLFLDEKAGKDYLAGCPKHLFDVCVPGKFCWANVGRKGWTLVRGQEGPRGWGPDYAETARFIALLVDNARTIATRRVSLMCNRREHFDWLTYYIRENW